jgi:hypothetical protein
VAERAAQSTGTGASVAFHARFHASTSRDDASVGAPVAQHRRAGCRKPPCGAVHGGEGTDVYAEAHAAGQRSGEGAP